MQETLVWSLRRSPGIGNGNLLQYSCLDNSGDRTAWWAIVHGVAKSGTRLSDWVYMRAHTRTPISLHGPAIKLSLLQTLMSWFVWPHYASGAWTCAQCASLCNCQYFHMFCLSACLVELFFCGNSSFLVSEVCNVSLCPEPRSFPQTEGRFKQLNYAGTYCWPGALHFYVIFTTLPPILMLS